MSKLDASYLSRELQKMVNSIRNSQDREMFWVETEAVASYLADKIESQNALMREALEAVDFPLLGSWYVCPWCSMLERQGHAPDCLRERALEIPATSLNEV